MVREFSEEKRQEIFRMLDEIDQREWKSFMEWCGSRAEEFGDWPDKLAVNAYTRYVDEYHEKVLEINEMTRQQVNTVFENVAEIDARYAARMRECQEKIKEQIAIVRTMTEFMDSMADGKPNMALITKGSVDESVDSLKVKNKNKLEAEINYANTATEENLNVISIDIDCYEIRDSLSLATYGIEDCMNTINELFKNGFVSEEDYRSICILAKEEISNPNSTRGKIEEYFNHVITTVYIYNCLQVLAGETRTITPEECCKVNEIFRYCNITDRNSIACLLICCAGESLGLTKTLEDFVPGNGYEYDERGAGYIQVTFKDIQRACLRYIYDMYGIEETIADQMGYAEEVAEYPWAASAWYWANYLVVDGKQPLNSYVMERLDDNGGELTLGIVLTAECFVHGNVDSEKNNCNGYTIDDALHVIARYDSLRLDNENGGWYVCQNENNNKDYRLCISIETMEYFKNNGDEEISALNIPSEWEVSEYLEFTAPYNWDTFADNYDKLDEAKLLDFDLNP